MDSCEDTRENTPDSDSGYVGSVVTVTSTSRTFPPNSNLNNALGNALGNAPNSNSSSNASKSTIVSPPSEVSKPSFLSEIQNAQRRRGIETTSMQAPVTPNGANINQPITNAAAMAAAAAANSSTLGKEIAICSLNCVQIWKGRDRKTENFFKSKRTGKHLLTALDR